MRVTPDTNLLVRMATEDDQAQARTALRIVASAREVVVPLPCILEFVWVLESVYRFSREEIAEALLTLVRMDNVSVDAASIGIGLRVHVRGGDFADGVIAGAGAAMGSEVFVSFDRKAVEHLSRVGMRAELATKLA